MHRKFWEAGYRVFGLHGINPDGSCACGNKQCDAAGKHPLTANWTLTPQWSEEQFDFMEEVGQFDSGYGVLMKDLFVVDIDARNGGVESYAKLVEDYPAIAGCGFIVATGSGGGSRHLYFKAPQRALVSHLPEYKGIDFKSSGFVVGAGSKHKSGSKYEVLSGSVDDIDFVPDDLIDALSKKERFRAEHEGRTYDVSHEQLGDMLSYITNTDLDYEVWIRIGMALHDASQGTAFDLWRAWSSTSSKHDDSHMQKKWHSFGKAANPVTIGTLIYYAEQGGWVQPVEFGPNEEVIEELQSDIDISGIDLKRPPGFVGDIAKWIREQSRYERETIAVGSALVSVGNLISLKYHDEYSDAASNLFVMCIAGSGSGKEAIFQAGIDIMKHVKLNKALHGTIKSEQEVVRNLVRHQAALYYIDEVGHLLKKVKTAETRGSASYLEGVIGILMSVYSKANGILPIGGDVREEVRKALINELNQVNKQMDENPAPKWERRAKSIEASLDRLDDGITNPYLSLLGMTTQVMFDDLVDYQNATNGFIGRCLVFRETLDVPDENKHYHKRKIPDDLKMTINQIFLAGSYDMDQDRVEYHGDKIQIPTAKDAQVLLKRVMDELHDLARDQEEKSGLQSLFLRAKEQVAKISFILAAAGGIRTKEHILWAYAMVKRDVEMKGAIVLGNDKKLSAKENLIAKLIGSIGDDPITFGVLVNKHKSFKKEDIEKGLEQLISAKKIVCEESIHSKKKIKILKYRRV